LNHQGAKTPREPQTTSSLVSKNKNLNKNPFRVGIDARLAYRRGVGTYTANLILALARVDQHNDYVLFNAPALLKSQLSNPRFKFVTVPFANAAYYEQKLLPQAAKAQGVQLLHYVDNTCSLFTDLPLVLTLHDAMYTRPLKAVRMKPTFRQRLIYAYKKWAIPRSAWFAKKVITVSSYSKTQIVKETGIPADKVTVTLEAVDHQLYEKQKHKRSGLFKIVVHGAADDRKNLSNILKVAKLLASKKKSFEMIVIGMDKDELACTPYERESLELGLEPYVKWSGNVRAEKMIQTYHDADLLLYPSRLEGFGLPVLEAFACGTPVITSNTTSLPEVAGDAALLVNPEDPQEIAEALQKAMEKPALRRQLIARGLKRAKLFRWEKTAKETLLVYESLFHGH
jgi:glycosyltransferase involved in cell wall biosynthesis